MQRLWFLQSVVLCYTDVHRHEQEVSIDLTGNIASAGENSVTASPFVRRARLESPDQAHFLEEVSSLESNESLSRPHPMAPSTSTTSRKYKPFDILEYTDIDDVRADDDGVTELYSSKCAGNPKFSVKRFECCDFKNVYKGAGMLMDMADEPGILHAYLISPSKFVGTYATDRVHLLTEPSTPMLDRNKPVTSAVMEGWESHIPVFAWEMSRALMSMIKHSLINRNINFETVRKDCDGEKCRFMLADFSGACKQEKCDAFFGEADFEPPEVLFGEAGAREEISWDLWSIGVMVWVMYFQGEGARMIAAGDPASVGGAFGYKNRLTQCMKDLAGSQTHWVPELLAHIFPEDDGPPKCWATRDGQCIASPVFSRCNFQMRSTATKPPRPLILLLQMLLTPAPVVRMQHFVRGELAQVVMMLNDVEPLDEWAAQLLDGPPDARQPPTTPDCIAGMKTCVHKRETEVNCGVEKIVPGVEAIPGVPCTFQELGRETMCYSTVKLVRLMEFTPENKQKVEVGKPYYRITWFDGGGTQIAKRSPASMMSGDTLFDNPMAYVADSYFVIEVCIAQSYSAFSGHGRCKHVKEAVFHYDDCKIVAAPAGDEDATYCEYSSYKTLLNSPLAGADVPITAVFRFECDAEVGHNSLTCKKFVAARTDLAV